jgi:hypothetical protein
MNKLWLFAAVLLVGLGGCAGFREWLAAPDPITGKAPIQVLAEAPAKILAGNWPTVLLEVAGVAGGGLLVLLGIRKVRVKRCQKTASISVASESGEGSG